MFYKIKTEIVTIRYAIDTTKLISVILLTYDVGIYAKEIQ
jgi:hypothetical protein